jgi:PAS domain S-box-containing protein
MNKAHRILVVDDKPAILHVFSSLLKGEGYEVYQASTGRQGLNRSRELVPDLVLLDVRLPDISGMEVCKQIKGDPDLSDVFVVLCSGEATSTSERVGGLETGADDYILKNVEPQELLARIRTILRLRDTTAALRASERHYRRLVEILPDPVLIFDLQGCLLSVNPQAGALLGYSHIRELLGKSAFDLVPPETREHFRSELGGLVINGFARNAEHTLVRKNGECFQVELSAALLKNDENSPPTVIATFRDINERKATQEALSASEQRFRELTENIREVFWMTDVTKKAMLYVSPGYKEVWGRDCQSLYTSPHTWLDAIHSEDRPRILQAALTKQASGEYDEVYRIVRPDGSLRWIQDRAFPIRDESGKVYRIAGIAEDITQRKQAEELLRESDARKDAIMQAALDAIITFDYEGKIIDLNAAAEEIFGFSGTTAAGRDVAMTIVSPPFREWSKPGLTEFVARRGDGTEFPIEMTVRRIAIPGPPTFTAFIRDISSRKSAEAQLTMLAHAVECTSEPICITDLDDHFVFVNRAFQNAYGYTREEIMGKTPELLASPNNPPLLLREILDTTRAGGWRGEVIDRRKDGTDFPVFLSTSLIRDSMGHVIGLMGVAQDITERRRAEEQLRLLANAVQSTQECISITDRENRFTFVNRAFVETFGYSEQEALGKVPGFLYAPTNPPGLCEEVYQQTLAGGWRGEIINLRKNGTECPISLTTSQIKNDRGEVLGLIGVARDISAQKRADTQNAARSQLAHRLSAAATPEQAAQSILDIAFKLFCGELGRLYLCSDADQKFVPILAVANVEGGPVPAQSARLESIPLLRHALSEGGQILNEENRHLFNYSVASNGEPGDCPASAMLAPIRSSGIALGILSIQSGKRGLYSPEDLQLFQSLADHCGGALQRIEAAEALSRAETKYRDLFENATEGIFQTNPEGRIINANPALARMFGYATPQEFMENVSDVARQLYARPEQRLELIHLLEQNGFVQGFEEENHRKDGTKLWVSLNGRVVRNAQGASIRYEGTIQDITERKWVENLLQTQRDFGVFLSSTNDSKAAAEQLLQIALQNEGMDAGAVYLVSPQSVALELAAEEGLSATFTSRASSFAMAQASSNTPGSPMAAMVGELRREGLMGIEAIPIQHSGQVVAILCLGSRLTSELPGPSRRAAEAIAAQAGGALVRIRAEYSLRASQERLAKTLQSLRSPVLIVDAETAAIQECNPATTRIFGHSRDEMIGCHAALLHLDRGRFDEFQVQQSLAFKKAGFLDNFEFAMKRKDGAVFPAEHTVMPIHDDSGRLVNWVSVVHDITERKRIEEELRQLPRRIIEAQEAEHFRVARELHDSVNQLIASARMRLRKVEEMVARKSPAAREILNRCGHLLVQALEENRRIAHDMRPTDLDALGWTIACRNFCKQFGQRTNIPVKCRISRFGQRLTPQLELNLFRIVQEAFTNIEKHARAKNAELRISSRKGSLLLAIYDDGRGFDPVVSSRPKKSGRGIGLTNLRERAAAAGGTCEIQSVAGQGTTIKVSIPLKATK